MNARSRSTRTRRVASTTHSLTASAASWRSTDLWAWNNLGRNVVFAGEDFRPRAVFDESVFSEDEPSQYDLDVHAILDVPSVGIVVTLNHLGMVRAFSSDAIRQPGPLAPRRARCGHARSRPDVERVVVLGDRIVGSRPREDRCSGSARQRAALDAGRRRTRWRWACDWRRSGWSPRSSRSTTAGRIASRSAAEGQVSLAPATADGIGQPRWTVDVDFEPRVVLWDGVLVWAAGM